MKEKKAPKPDQQRTTLSKKQLAASIGKTADSGLHLVAHIGDVFLFRDLAGTYYLDRVVSDDLRGFERSKYGEYSVQRQRRRVTPETALKNLLAAAIPPDLMDLLPGLFCQMTA